MILQRYIGCLGEEFKGKIDLIARGKADRIAVDPFTDRSTRDWASSLAHLPHDEPCLAPLNALNAELY
jgi:hypothetical protein